MIGLPWPVDAYELYRTCTEAAIFMTVAKVVGKKTLVVRPKYFMDIIDHLGVLLV